MCEQINLTIAGAPVPQGSVRPNGHGGVYYANATRLRPYRDRISLAIKELLGPNHDPWLGAVLVTVTFVFERPKSHFKADGVTLTPRAPLDMTVPPDTDKLVRAVGDALTQSGIYKDDAQVIQWTAAKEYGPQALTRIDATLFKSEETE